MTDVRLLGPVEIGPTGNPTRIAAGKQRTLLAALALHAGRAVDTAALVEVLWGEQPPASAGKLLQVYVSQLRQVLPPGVVLSTCPPGYALDIPPERVDTSLFAGRVDSARRTLLAGAAGEAAAVLRSALALWRGPPLADVGPALLFDAEAERLVELRIGALELLYAARLERGEAAELTGPLQSLADEHPLREGLHASLMLALYRCGRQADALAAYTCVRARLRSELGLDPGAALQELHGRVLRQDPALDRDRPAPLGAVPTPLTSTIGREPELAALESLLTDPAVRLVTVTGPGGSGKTRLSVLTADRLQHRYADGAVIVALEAVRDPALALNVLATALGVREPGDDPLATMVRELGHRKLLVVLDNLEQVVEVGPSLAVLLSRLPGLTLLATSRVLLSVGGERAFPLRPLAVPAPRSSAADIAASPAVTMFCDRARAALPSFALTEDNTSDVAELCRRLDGLPLALELAAAQSRLLAPDELLSRFGSGLDAPGSQQRDRPLRHRSLRSVLDGSFELLSPEARTLLGALSVFVGGFDLPAAEQVTQATPATLGELLDHSLVQVLSAPARRFTLLETIRAFAVEKGSGTGTRRRHSDHYLRLAEEAGAELDGPNQAARMVQLDREQGNLRAAFAGLREVGDSERELRLAVALARFWYIRGHLAESRSRLSDALDQAAALAPQLRADALRKISANAVLRGEYDEALVMAEKALAIYDEIGDDLGRARSLSNIGAVAHASGDHGRAAVSLDEAIELARQLGADRVMALALNNRGDLCLTLGDFVEATRLFGQSRALLEDQGDTTNVARSLLNLGLSAMGRGAFDDATDLVLQSLALSVQLDDAEDIAWCLLARAALLERAGQRHPAALLLGAAESVLREIDAVFKPYERALHAATTTALTGALGAAGLAEARSRGARLELADAVVLAREGTPAER